HRHHIPARFYSYLHICNNCSKMLSLVFVTGSAEKFKLAREICEPLGLALVQRSLNTDEIQNEDSEVIIRDKVRKAVALVGEPVGVSDDSWDLPGLRGFPGPYIKSIDHWFTPEDFLNLTRPLKDRRAILVQLLAYSHGTKEHVVRKEHTGTLLTESRGN